MKSLVSLCIVATALPLLAASPYGTGFASGDPEDYLEGTVQARHIRIVPAGGTNTLLISDARARLKAVPVAPNAKYKLSFHGSFTGAVESFEDNPRFEVFTRPGQKSPVLPSREIHFLDAAGKPAGRAMAFSMPFRSKRPYTDVFHTPHNAATMRLDVASGNGVNFTLGNLKLQKVTNEEAINVNPLFRLGLMNYSGWQNVSAGGKIITMKGKTVLDTKYGSRGMAFPLQSPGAYELSAKATGNGYNSCVILEVFDAKGKRIMRSVIRRYGQPNYFVLPKNAVSGSLLVYSCLLEEVRLVRVWDEKSVDTFLKKSKALSTLRRLRLSFPVVPTAPQVGRAYIGPRFCLNTGFFPHVGSGEGCRTPAPRPVAAGQWR